MSASPESVDAPATLVRVAEACDDLVDAWMTAKPGAALPGDDVVRETLTALIGTIPASKDVRIADLRDGLDEARSIIDMEMQTPRDVAARLVVLSRVAREDASWSRVLKEQAREATTTKKTTAHGPSAMPPFGAMLARRTTGR